MKIVFMGTPFFSVPILEAIKDQTLLVVTKPDETKNFSPVKKKALELGIKVFQPQKIKDDYHEIINLKPDVIITAAYGQMLPQVILDLFCINIHASLLPKYRGGAPIHRAIMNGDEVTGITIMKMAKKMDAGDILIQRSIPINEDDNTSSMFNKLSFLARDLLVEVLSNIKELKAIKQNEEEVTYAYNITRDDELVDFSKNGVTIVNQIRGLSDELGGYFILDQKVIKVFKATFLKQDILGDIGEVVILEKKRLGIKVSDGILFLENLQMQGKKRMDIVDFLNGYRNHLFLHKVI